MILIGKGGPIEQIGTVPQSLCESPFTAPATDGLVAAAGEDFGDGVAAEVGGAGVVGIIEEAAGGTRGSWRSARDMSGGNKISAEALKASRVGIAEDTGEEANNSVDNDGGSQFSSRKDVITDGEFAIAEKLVDALIDTLIAAAEEDDPFHRGQLVRYRLGKRAALR